MRKSILLVGLGICVSAWAQDSDLSAFKYSFFFYPRPQTTREAQIRDNKKYLEEIFLRTCSKLLHADAIASCKGHADRFLKENEIPCNPELLRLFKYNLVDRACDGLPDHAGETIPGTTRKIGQGEIGSRCLFYGYAFSFPPEPGRYRHANPEATSEMFSQLQVRIQDPCMSKSFPSRNYEKCFRDRLATWIMDSYSTLASTELSILVDNEHRGSEAANNGYRHCGGMMDTHKDATAADKSTNYDKYFGSPAPKGGDGPPAPATGLKVIEGN